MATNMTFNGVVYSIPAEGDDGWGTVLSNLFIAIGSGALQKTGGTFTLTAEVDFGATYGLKLPYIKSKATNPAGAGFMRLGNTETIVWRNAANSGDLSLTVNASDVLQYNGSAIMTAGTGSIVNADIAPGAAIALSKLAVVTASRALVSDGSGLISPSAVTDVELGYLSGVTSSIQTQLGTKASLTGAEVLTNKTIVAASNTVTTAASGNLAATELNAALAELDSAATAAQTAGDDAQFDINTHIADLANPHAVTKAQIGLSNVNDTSDATKNSATATLTNKTFSDPITLTEVATPSTPAAGLKKLYPKADGKMYTLDDAGIETEVGSGGGSGGINYIDNGDAETDTTGWATYADLAGSVPVNGIDGSPTLTFTRTTSSPLRGTASFLITKAGGSSLQGEGASYDFTIDAADKAQMLQISADVEVASGTYDSGSSTANSDLICYIYDVSNSRLIEPAGMKIQSGVKLKATFQTSSDSTSYRLIFHQSLTGTSAYTLKIDNISVGPQVTASGYAGSDWVAYTPTGAWIAGSPVYTGRWRRVGDELEGQVNVLLAGATTAAGFTASIPPGLVIDQLK